MTAYSQSYMSFFAVIPAIYRPDEETIFPMITANNGVEDTGLISSVHAFSNGTVRINRDIDGAPANFTGDSGIDYAWSMSWVVA